MSYGGVESDFLMVIAKSVKSDPIQSSSFIICLIPISACMNVN